MLPPAPTTNPHAGILGRLVLGGLTALLLSCSTMTEDHSLRGAADGSSRTTAVTSAEIEGFWQTVQPVRGNAESIYRLGLHFQKQGRHAWAIDEFRRVLAVDAGHARACNGIGVSLDLLGRYPEAAAAYGRAIALDPNFHEAWNNLGYSSLLAGDPAAALASFRRAIALEGRNPRYHNNLGLAYARLGREAEAYAELRLAGGEDEARRHMARLAPAWQPPDGAGAPAMAHSASHPSKVTGSASAPENSQSPTAVPEALPAPTAEDRNGRSAERAMAVVTAPAPSPLDVVMVPEADGFRLAVIPPQALAAAPGPITAGQAQLSSRPEMSAPVAAVPDQTPAVAVTPSPLAPTAGFSITPAPPRELETPYLSARLEPTAPDDPPPLLGSFLPVAPPSPPDPREALQATILVSNGNGVRHMAAQVRRFLRGQGFQTGGVRNAEHFRHMETVIYYRQGFLQEAYALARAIPGYQNLETFEGSTHSQAPIHLVLGRDLIPLRQRFDIDG